MRRRTVTIVLVVLALAIPTSVALAKGNPPTRGKSAPKVTYVLKGTLSDFAAASVAADGSVTISVTHANHHARALVGQQVTFGVSLKTSTTLAGGTILNGAHGVVKFRAPLRVSNTTLMATLKAVTPMTATKIVAH
jgi:hypothetical protein